ncbi:MAG: RidA family protein [Chloroflexota bacterium]|nr:RidA family protein [Chloroflexota bacterium]
MAQGFNAPGIVKPVGIFSSAAWQPPGRVLHISGHVSQDMGGNIVHEGDIVAQTRQVLENIRSVLASVGGTMADIQKMTIYVTDLSRLIDLRAVQAEFFSLPYPASTLVQVSALVRPEYLIEIEAVAVIPEDRVREPT